MKTYLGIYLGSLVLALVATPAAIWLARKIGAVDRPGARSIHKQPIPRIGGVAVFVAAMALIVSVIFLNNNIGQAFRAMWLPLATLLGAAAAIFLVGLYDDLRGLPARVKLVAELVMAIVLCLADVRITGIELTSNWVLPLGGASGCLLTIFWIVGVTNAVNLSDGLDGLAAGVSAIACGVIAIFAVHSDNPILAVFMLALLGSLSGFLVFNFNPAKIFLGDCGSLFLGFTIAATSVLCVAKSATFVGLALPALALGIPIFDTLFAMLRRFLERRSLFAPDRSHFHHRLLDLGLKQKHAVLTIYLATLLATGMGLFMMISENLSTLVIFLGVLILIALLFRLVGAVRLGETLSRLQDKRVDSCRQRDERKTFEQLQLQFRRVESRAQWWQVVCEAADRMDFAWIALKSTHADGRIDEEIWRCPDVRVEVERIITMTIPLAPADPKVSRQFEIAICANGSVEAASRRATLFGRLLDEHGSGSRKEFSEAN